MVKVAEAWVPVDDTTGANGVGNGTAGPVHGGGLVSETTMAFATIVWGAMPLPVGTRSGLRFGEAAMPVGPTSRMATVVSAGIESTAGLLRMQRWCTTWRVRRGRRGETTIW